MSDPSLTVLNDTGKFSKVSLVPPSRGGYLLLAGEVGTTLLGTFPADSAAKRRLLTELKRSAARILDAGLASSAAVFTARLIPPGRGGYLRRRPDAKIAGYDVALLIQTGDVAGAQKLFHDSHFQSIKMRVEASSRATYAMVGENLRQIGPVDHERDGVFLINYFLAEREARNLAVWEHTAGWFQDQTGLDNSELLRPLEQEGADYTIVNHCRWNRLTDILPSLIFKPSFRRYVLRHFEANDTAAMPILYSLA